MLCPLLGKFHIDVVVSVDYYPREVLEALGGAAPVIYGRALLPLGALVLPLELESWMQTLGYFYYEMQRESTREARRGRKSGQ